MLVGVIMNKESAWEKFQKTGSVADYLQYCFESKKEENNR